MFFGFWVSGPPVPAWTGQSRAKPTLSSIPHRNATGSEKNPLASLPSTVQPLLHSQYQAQRPRLVPTQGRRIRRLLAVAGAESRRRDFVGAFNWEIGERNVSVCFKEHNSWRLRSEGSVQRGKLGLVVEKEKEFQSLHAFARVLRCTSPQELSDLAKVATEHDGRLARHPLTNSSREIKAHQKLLSN